MTSALNETSVTMAHNHDAEEEKGDSEACVRDTGIM